MNAPALRSQRWLRTQGHEVFSVYQQARGMEDRDVIQKSFDEGWILITNDRDFGQEVYREGHPHRGVVFLRLADERAVVKIDALRRLLERYADKLPDRFVVVTETRVRFGRYQPHA